MYVERKGWDNGYLPCTNIYEIQVIVITYTQVTLCPICSME